MSAGHFEIINPQALREDARLKGGCGEYSDAPVCTNASQDVTCTGEIYRGCAQGQTDCANDPDGNKDDRCCAGWGPGVGDNIDHASCFQQDADYGGISFCTNDMSCCTKDGPREV